MPTSICGEDGHSAASALQKLSGTAKKTLRYFICNSDLCVPHSFFLLLIWPATWYYVSSSPPHTPDSFP